MTPVTTITDLTALAEAWHWIVARAEYLNRQIAPTITAGILPHCHPAGFEADSGLIIQVNNPTAADWLIHRINGKIAHIAAEATGGQITAVRFIPPAEPQEPSQ